MDLATHTQTQRAQPAEPETKTEPQAEAEETAAVVVLRTVQYEAIYRLALPRADGSVDTVTSSRVTHMTREHLTGYLMEIAFLHECVAAVVILTKCRACRSRAAWRTAVRHVTQEASEKVTDTHASSSLAHIDATAREPAVSSRNGHAAIRYTLLSCLPVGHVDTLLPKGQLTTGYRKVPVAATALAPVALCLSVDAPQTRPPEVPPAACNSSPVTANTDTQTGVQTERASDTATDYAVGNRA